MLKFIIKLFAIFVFLIPLFFFVAKGSDPQPASADSCTFKAINTTGNTNEPVEVVITQASPFTTYTFTVSKGGTRIKSQDVGSGPIIAGGDVRYTFSGSNFTSTGDYVFFVSSPGGAGCSGFPFTVNLTPRFDPCTFKAINTTGYTKEPVEVVITQANPFTNYTFTVNKGGTLVKSQVVGSGPIVVGGDVRYTFAGSLFNSSGDYVLFVAAPGGAACSGFPFTINLDTRLLCTLTVSPFREGQDVSFTLNASSPGTYTVVLYVRIDLDVKKWPKTITVPDPPTPVSGSFPGAAIVDFSGIEYKIIAYKGAEGGPECATVENAEIVKLVPGKNPCGLICKTALGDISTSIGPFAKKILEIGIGLAGGIALIIMVIGAIRVLTSAGDPKNVAAGREMIIAAIAGLLFLIFSVLILKFIGENIVGL